jgi:hypothetical protein
VRAGEAKLCGRMCNVVLIAGTPGRSVGGARGCSDALFANLLCTGTWVLTDFSVNLSLGRSLLLTGAWVLRIWFFRKA